ncbi:MAG TPA: LysR family transcriptional regulator [Solimonas sp.]|nr:LysR family transcriptional regulator [Solimonas sp.]
MELRHLRYFVAVAEELHFTRAAQKLGLGQPPLSQQIQALERELGTPLFRRLPRGVALTEAGRCFLDDARSILASVERATEQARRVAAGNLGRLRVGMINSAPFHPFVPRVIREFGQRYPEVALSIDENSTPALAAAVLAQQADIAFVRPLLGDSSGLTTEHLFDEDMLVALPQGHPLARFRTLSLWALASENFVLFPRLVGSGLYDEIIAACQRSGFSPRVTQEASQVTSIVNLVAAGLGVSLVPASMQQVNSEGVTYRAIAGDGPRARMSLIYREGEDSPTVANLVALARERVGRPRARKPKG